MKLLLTNDDGIAAAGLEALGKAAAALGEIVRVAPHIHLSGCSHRVTTDQPLRATQQAPGRWAIEGTPADCVRIGLANLLPDADWVLSGINHGGNLGADVHVSGTVAAVREGVLHGKPGIALSQYRKRNVDIDWDRAVRWVAPLLAELMGRTWVEGTFWNINLPHLEPGEPEPDVVFCPLETGPLPLSFREEAGHYHYNGNYHERSRRAGSDVDVCFSGNIAVTRIAIF
jgi:5'-nucleotidase